MSPAYVTRWNPYHPGCSSREAYSQRREKARPLPRAPSVHSDGSLYGCVNSGDARNATSSVSGPCLSPGGSRLQGGGVACQLTCSRFNKLFIGGKEALEGLRANLFLAMRKYEVRKRLRDSAHGFHLIFNQLYTISFMLTFRWIT